MFNRRCFIKSLFTGAGLGAFTFAACSAQARKLAIKLKQVPALEKVGGSVIVKLGGKEVILIRDSHSSVKALSPICTHNDCFVSYQAGVKKLACKCHGSFFDLNGKVLTGPAKKRLQTYEAILETERIVVKVD